MIPSLLLFLQQDPASHYAGAASSKTAGTTALAGHFFRFLFSTVPQWVQIAGIVIGVPGAAIVAWQLWKHRRAVWAWWQSRHAGVRFAIVAGVFVIAAGAATSGLYGYNYVMHQNDFCQSCHIMDTAWNRFQVSAHKNLQCHACHRQPLYVSSVELYFWVTERRMIVPVHDKVPTAVCSECHMQQGTDSALTQVMLTAGHAVHLKSDSSALANVQCVTCHGRDFHQFVPSNASCAQSGCHVGTRVNLGAMSARAFPHCTVCHDFRNRVPLGITVTAAKSKLLPKSVDCFSCHAMAQKTRAFDLASDPHKGNCGMCHDPHKQNQPKDAFKTCAQSQCHGAPDTLTSFHRGLAGHSLAQCGSCHQAHTWKVKGTDCLSCHKTINQDRPPRRVGSSITPTQRRSFRLVASPTTFLSRHRGVVRRHDRRRGPERVSMVQRASLAQRPTLDTTFRHSRHASIACTECHGTTNTHGGLKFATPAGCAACHHSNEQRATCTTCHAAASLGARSVLVSFMISARRDPVTRPLVFAHTTHAALNCAKCHSSDVTRAVAVTCATCHSDHHTPTADCTTCHAGARTGHDRSVHEGCARCHTDAKVEAIPVSRAVCIVCHQEQRNHYPNRDCATCHALPDHDLMRAGRPGTGR